MKVNLCYCVFSITKMCEEESICFIAVSYAIGSADQLKQQLNMLTRTNTDKKDIKPVQENIAARD